VAIDSVGKLFTSTDPAARTPTWKPASPESGTFMLGGLPAGIDCPTVHLCVGFDALGNVLSSTNPASGRRAWHVAHVDTTPGLPSNFGVSCPSIRFCAIIDANHIFVTQNPTGPASGWQLSDTFQTPFGGAISCPTTSFCVAINGNYTLITAAPLSPSRWTSSQLQFPACPTQTSCQANAIYANDSRGTRLIDSAGPAGSPQLTDLALSNSQLTWQHNGTPRRTRLS
jgi:hypothetical protein